MNYSSKINWLLIAQGWAMLLVIIGHSPMFHGNPRFVETITNIVYSFHMQLFIFVSGFLFYMTRIEKPMRYWAMLSEKIKRLGIPFFLFTFIAMIIKSIFSSDMSRPTEISSLEYVKALIYPYDGPMREFWFIAVIMWLFAGRALFNFLLSKRSYAISGFFLLILINYFVPLFSNDIFCFPRALHYSIYFFAGMAFYKWELIKMINNYWLAFLLCSASFFLLFLFLPVKIGILVSFSGIGMSLFLAKLLDTYLPKIFFSFRNYTFQIYLMGIFFQIAIKILYNKQLFSYWGGYFLCLIVGLYAPVLISLLVKKINWEPLYYLIGLSRSK